MNRRLWFRIGMALIAIGLTLAIWVEVDPPTTVSGFTTWGLVALAYGLAMVAWCSVQIPRLLDRYYSRKRPSDGPEVDYDDGPPGSD